MVVVVAHLWLQEVSIFQYIDDWLLLTSSRDILLCHVQLMTTFLQSLGIVNSKKSCLTPTQCLPFIGAILDSLRSKAFLPPESYSVACSDRPSIIRCLNHHAPGSVLIGTYWAAAMVVVPYTCRHTHPLQL